MESAKISARWLRLRRSIEIVWQSIRRVLCFGQPEPFLLIDQPALPTYPCNSQPTAHANIRPSRDRPLLAADGFRLKPASCCIWHDPELSKKILEACRVAREAGYELLWIDSCCINKDSSSELSEAINSMYRWYGLSRVCYAYLAGVAPGEDPSREWSAFRRSRWFRRGWTLQELIAPEIGRAHV